MLRGASRIKLTTPESLIVSNIYCDRALKIPGQYVFRFSDLGILLKKVQFPWKISVYGKNSLLSHLFEDAL